MKTLQQLEEAKISPAEIAAAEQAIERKLSELDEQLNAFCQKHGLPMDVSADELLAELYYEEPRRQEICDGMQAIVNEYEKVLRFYDRSTKEGTA